MLKEKQHNSRICGWRARNAWLSVGWLSFVPVSRSEVSYTRSDCALTWESDIQIKKTYRKLSRDRRLPYRFFLDLARLDLYIQSNMEKFRLCLEAKRWTHIWNRTKFQQPPNGSRTRILKEQTDISYLVGVMRLEELTGGRCTKDIRSAFMSILNLQNFCTVVDCNDFTRAEAAQCNAASPRGVVLKA